MPAVGDHASVYKDQAKRGKEDCRRRRQGEALQLRKNKREENLSKRRNINLSGLENLDLKLDAEGAEEKENVPQQVSNVPQPKLMPLEDIVNGITSSMPQIRTNSCDYNALYTFVQHCRKMLSRERKPPIDNIIEAGLVPYLTELLALDTIVDPTSNVIVHSIMFEAAWALTNICSGSAKQTLAVVESGALPHFIRLLTLTDHLNVVEQAAWALGNIAGDGAELRDKVLGHKVLKPLLRLLKLREATTPFLQNTTWTLSNLCRNKNPPTALSYVKELLPTLVNLLKHSDRQIKTDSCWAMSYLTDGSNDRIDLVLQYEALGPLVNLLTHNKDISIITPVLRSIGNIVTGTDQQTQKVLDAGTLTCFQTLLKHEKTSIQKEAVWTLSNITAGTPSQIQAVIEAGLVQPIMEALKHGDFKTQKEAVWAVTNFTSGGTSEQVRLLCQSGAISGLCNMLTCHEDRTVQVILDGIQNILIHAEKLDCLDNATELIEECQGLEKIEKLQHSANDQIYQSAYRLIEAYFAEEDQENVGPDVLNTINKDGQLELKDEPAGADNPTFQF